MIPNFDNEPVTFTKFIQANQHVFAVLFNKRGLTDGLNRKYIHDGYLFFRDFNLSDDADIYSLIENLDDFNTGKKGEIKIQKLIEAFKEWLHIDKVKQEFKKEFNIKFKQELNSKLNYFKEKAEPMQRTQSRTSQIKEEIIGAPYVPDNRPDSVIGKKYRTTKREFIGRQLTDVFSRRKIGGKKQNKTKKYGKSRRLKNSASLV